MPLVPEHAPPPARADDRPREARSRERTQGRSRYVGRRCTEFDLLGNQCELGHGHDLGAGRTRHLAHRDDDPRVWTVLRQPVDRPLRS